MPVFNIGNFLSSVFTWLKLGCSLVVMVFLINKLIDVWQDTPNTFQETEPTRGLAALKRISGD